MDKQIKVSVIVPVFMVYPYIDQCIDSICRQTEKNIEIICVYTESKDGTFDKLKKWLERDSRIKLVVRNDGGLGGARNTGMEHATGKYIAFVDSDDWIEATMLQKLEEVADAHSADVVMCAIRSFDETKKEFLENSWGSHLPFSDDLLGKSFTWQDISPEVFVSPDAPVTAWNKLYRTSFIKNEKLKFPENCRYEDNPFYYEIMASARVSFVQDAYYNYRVNRAGSLQASSCMDESLFDIIKIMKSISNMLISRKIGEKYYKTFYAYMLDEFSWRFQTLHGNKRKFLKAVNNAFAEKVYIDFLKALSNQGENLNSSIFRKAVNNLPQVSVVIPTYNNAHELVQCLNSVLGQTDIILEVYCVDDNSTDSTSEVLQHYCEKDGRVHAIYKNKNSGAGISRELAMQEINGEFVFFLDGDDLLPHPETLHKMYMACKKNKKLTCAGNMQCFYNNDPTQISTYSGNVFSESGTFSYENYIPHPSWGFTRFLFNLEVILENDIHFPEWRYYEDPLFFVRYMTVEKEYFAITDTVYLYRQKKDAKEIFSESKFYDLFTSLKIILPLLYSVNKRVYYAEYHTFLQFCIHLYDYLKGNPQCKKKLIQGANEIFQIMDFSEYHNLFQAQEVIRSYEQFENIQYGKEAVPAMLLIETEDNNMSEESEQGSALQRPSFLRRIIKKLLKPFYAPFRNRYETPLWEARGYASGTWNHTAQLLQQMGKLQEQLHAMHQEVQSVNVALSQYQIKIMELQQKQEDVATIAKLCQQEEKALYKMSEQNKKIKGNIEEIKDAIMAQKEHVGECVSEQRKWLEDEIVKQNKRFESMQYEYAHRLDLIEISINGQEKWDALQIQKRLFNLQFLCEMNFNKESEGDHISAIYGKEFYEDNRFESVISGTEVFRVLFPILSPQSVLDIGCGTGTWLYAAKKFGVKIVHGIDGDYVNPNMLMISNSEFEAYNLEKLYETDVSYDLTISLEVAEHLDKKYADVFVETLCGNSNVILFSAAHPGQGGDGHLNEQPLEYWKEKIEAKGYKHIEIRPLFKDNQNIAWWYRDNIALFVRNGTQYDEVKKQIEEKQLGK